MLVKTQSQQQATWHCDLHAQITHAIIVIDSMNPLQKVKSGMGCPNWHRAMHSLWLQRLMWIYCPGHAGVSGNERADRLASTADITSGLQLSRAKVLRGLRNFLNMDRPEHHSINCLKTRGLEKGSGWHSTFWGQERSMFNQTNIGIVSRATLRRQLRDGVEHIIMGLSERYNAAFSWNWKTEWNWSICEIFSRWARGSFPTAWQCPILIRSAVQWAGWSEVLFS